MTAATVNTARCRSESELKQGPPCGFTTVNYIGNIQYFSWYHLLQIKCLHDPNENIRSPKMGKSERQATAWAQAAVPTHRGWCIAELSTTPG